MLNKRTLIVAASLLVAACSEVTGPGEFEIDRAPLSDAAPVSAISTLKAPDGTLTHLPDAPHLETYSTSFRVVQGKLERLQIHYANATEPDSTREWFARIVIPMDAQFVDDYGSPVADGDTVTVSVDIDATRFFVRFGPHGSQFSGAKTAVLTYNLKYADLGGRDIEAATIWYQPSEGQSWSAEPTEVDVGKRQVSIHLRHFSNYAVAW